MNRLGVLMWTENSEYTFSPKPAFKGEKQKLEYWLSCNGSIFSKVQQEVRDILSPQAERPRRPFNSGMTKNLRPPLGFSAKETAELDNFMKDLNDDEIELKDEDFFSPEELIQLAASKGLSGSSTVASAVASSILSLPLPAPTAPPLAFRPPTAAAAATLQRTPSAAGSVFRTSFAPAKVGYQQPAAKPPTSSPYSVTAGGQRPLAPTSYHESSSFTIVGYVCNRIRQDTRTLLDIDDEKNSTRMVIIEDDSGVINFADTIWRELLKVKLRFTLRWKPGGPQVLKFEPADPKCKEARFFPPPTGM